MQKTVNGVVTRYTLNGKNVAHMTRGSDELHFFYDAQNRPAVVIFNGTAYAYVKNLQGDIVAILDQNGNAVVEYTYDVWGNPTSKTGSMVSTLGVVNPFRYRGYVYDEEMGLYYLRSRYYNPSWCRFVNADAVMGNGRILSTNMFASCLNNAVMNSDSDGASAHSALANTCLVSSTGPQFVPENGQYYKFILRDDGRYNASVLYRYPGIEDSITSYLTYSHDQHTGERLSYIGYYNSGTGNLEFFCDYGLVCIPISQCVVTGSSIKEYYLFGEKDIGLSPNIGPRWYVRNMQYALIAWAREMRRLPSDFDCDGIYGRQTHELLNDFQQYEFGVADSWAGILTKGRLAKWLPYDFIENLDVSPW